MESKEKEGERKRERERDPFLDIGVGVVEIPSALHSTEVKNGTIRKMDIKKNNMYKQHSCAIGKNCEPSSRRLLFSLIERCHTQDIYTRFFTHSI